MPHSASEFLAAATWTGIIPADFLLAERGFGGITLWRSVDVDKDFMGGKETNEKKMPSRRVELLLR